MALDDQRFKDHCLIIVGDGGKADQVLAKRRLEAGGCLAHFLIDGLDDPRVHFRESLDDSTFDYFTWQPPKASMGISSFAKKLGGKPRTFWTKNGPDGIELASDQQITIGMGVSGKARHVTVVDWVGNVLVEMSGEVVVNPDMYTAETLQVDVHNTELNAFGTFSWRFVRLALVFQFLWQVAKISLSIQFEKDAAEGRIPWFRNLLGALNWCLTGNIICVEMTSYALTGHKATSNMHVVGNLAAAVGIMAVAPLKLSEFALCLVGVTCMFLVAPPLHYYQTMGDSPYRRLIPHVKWAIVQLSGTAGCFFLFGLIGQTYATLLASGQSVVAMFFLPFGTAIGETGIVVYTRIMYNYLVHSHKIDPQGPLAGDQIVLAAPCLIMSAHAFAEGCRLTATLSGAISSGGFAWIPTTILSLCLNLSARLGWSRFTLIQIAKYTRGGPTAMAYFAPTGWSKYHDELKIYAGYFRFSAILALVAARAISYGVSGVDGPEAPAFNLSATLVIICLLCGEVMEDEIVTNELLPVNPAGPGLLNRNVKGDNADPCQLITLEHLPNVPAGDPWKMSELEESGRLSKASCLRRTTSKGSVVSTTESTGSAPITEPPKKTVSLSNSDTYTWARLRKWFGQPRSLNSAAGLHGLREFPLSIHISFIGITAEFTMGLLALLVGAGHVRGTCPEVLTGPDRIFGLAYWDVPLPC